MKIEIRLPELGEGIADAVIATWNYKEGDTITDEDDIAEVVTDKAVFNIPSDNNGTIFEISAKEGEKVKIGEVIAVLET